MMERNAMQMNNMNTNRGVSSNITNDSVNRYSGPRNFFPGSFVTGANDINPDGIPGDGTLCLYPQADFKAIYAKQWTNSGLMSVKYVPETMQEKKEIDQTEVLNAIFDRLNNIEQRLNWQPKRKPKYVDRRGNSSNVEKGDE